MKSCYNSARKGTADALPGCLPSDPDFVPDADEKTIHDGEPIFLCSAGDGIEATMLMAALEDSGIPTLHKTRGAGQVLRVGFGMSYQGVDVFVPPLLLEQAQEVAAVVLGMIPSVPEDEDTEDDSLKQELEHSVRNKRRMGWLLLAVLLGVPGVVVVMGILILKLLMNG